MSKYTTDELIRCVDRELGFRRQVYGARVQRQQMPQAEADRQIGMMEEIKARLVAEKERECPTLF